MGLTKTEAYTARQLELAEWAKALGHPARIAILQQVLNARQCINAELVQELGLAQATVSQHLNALKLAGILQGTVEGSRMNYCINPGVWKKLEENFSAFFKAFEDPSNSCCQ